MIFTFGRDGWTDDSLDLLENMIWRYCILSKETLGISSCVISLHNMIHIPDDIRRFGSSDNYWCYVFERVVHNYVEKSSNKKNLELTFAKSESRRELFKFLSQKQEASSMVPSVSSDVCYINLLITVNFVHILGDLC